jgi:hypothetical protein
MGNFIYQKTNDGYEAYNNKGKRVATLVLTEEIDDSGIVFVQNISVNPAEQGKGIGAELIKIAKAEYEAEGLRIIFNNVPQSAHGDDPTGTYMSEEGTAFMRALLRKGIITKKNVLDPDRVGNIEVKKKEKESPKAGASILDYLCTKKPPEDDDSDDNKSDKKITLSFK